MIELAAGTPLTEKPLCPSENPLQSPHLPWWMWMNILSLEAVSVAVVWQLLLARAYHLESEPAIPIALGGSVWVIYLLDHLLDTGAIPTRPEPPRKTFFRHHRRLMLGVTLSGALVTLLIARFYLSERIFRTGLEYGLVVLLYFLAVHLLPLRVRLLWPRQAAVAALFSAGVALPLWLNREPGILPLGAAVSPFFMLCWLNCCAVEVWEWQAAGRLIGFRPDPAALWVADHFKSVATIIALLTCLSGLRGMLSPFIVVPYVLSAAAFVAIALGRQASARITSTALSCMLLDIALLSPLLTLFTVGNL